MPHSFTTSANLECPHCRQPFTSELWLIVDADERPDLAERIRAGTLHDLACPHCAEIESVNAPLLVLRPTQKPPLIFVPAGGATAQQNQQRVDQLVALLRQNIGNAWQAAWIDESDSLQWAARTQSSFPSLQTLLDEIDQLTNIFDMPRRVQLCQTALIQIERAQNPILWAALQGELGNSLAQNPQGDRAENLEQAISSYKQALQVETQQVMPVEWAATTMNLALTYSNRIRGDQK